MLGIWPVSEQPRRSATIDVQMPKDVTDRSPAKRELDVKKHLNNCVVRIQFTEFARILPFLQ